MIKRQLSFMSYNRRNRERSKGSAIIETCVGLFVLLPIFLILLDIISLVIGQTINDDIAKNAARYACQGATQAAAQAYADNYIANCQYSSGGPGLVTGAHIQGGVVHWSTTSTMVITEVTVNLPVAVPLGGPKSQVMQSQATFTTVGVPANPQSAAAAGS